MPKQVNVILPKDGAILAVPEDTPIEALKQLSEQLHAIWPDRKFMMIAGDVKSLSEEDMNRHGWYKRAHNE